MIKTFSNEFNMYKSGEKMQCLEVEQGIVLPRLFCDNGPSWGLGGVCDSNNEFVELSFYDGGWAKHGGKYDWQQEEYIDEEVIYFGVFVKHWGHFLVDLLGRAWYLPKIDEQVKVVYIGEEDPVGNYLEFFELLGIKPEQLLHVTKPTRFRKVIVPQFACRPCIWYTDEYLSTFDYLADKIEKEQYIPASMEKLDKVYFARLNFGKAAQTEFGEGQIAEWMKVNGYTIISPEKLTLRDQIYIWNHAKEIVCLNGSIPINIMFSKNKNLKLVVMNKTSLIHKNLDLFILMRDCKATFLDVYREPVKGYPKSIGAGPFLLGISEDIKEYSKQHGMKLPFNEKQVVKAWRINTLKLVWCIWDVKGRVRRTVSRLVSDDIKAKVRSLRK